MSKDNLKVYISKVLEPPNKVLAVGRDSGELKLNLKEQSIIVYTTKEGKVVYLKLMEISRCRHRYGKAG